MMILTGTTTENKLKPIPAILGQLLANMEKLAGEIVYSHLLPCTKKLVRLIDIYGLVINLGSESCDTSYEKKSSQIGRSVCGCGTNYDRAEVVAIWPSGLQEKE